ncbi:MAG: hypothetical protein JNK02_02550 [Planctomycetes bacterium]|nr:hypothetical protein [Planctomycetota bacterium]
MVDALRRMEARSDTIRNGLRTGLTDFAWHVGVSHAPWERPIYVALGNELTEAGYATDVERNYPGGSPRICDLVVRDDGGGCCWLEVKLIWTEWMSTATGAVKRSDFSSYVLGPGPGRLDRDHSLAQDFEKLEFIGPSDGSHSMVLAIVFDAVVSPADPLIRQMESEQQVRRRGWELEQHVSWPDLNSSAHRIGVWTWMRATGAPKFDPPSSVAETPDDLLQRIQDDTSFLARAEPLLLRYVSKGLYGWSWEDWIAGALQVERDCSLVAHVGERLRREEGPWRAERYASRNARERLCSRIQDLARHQIMRMREHESG